MKLEALIWLILFLPLLAAGIITLFTLRNKAVSATLSIGAVVAGFVLSLAVIKFGGWEARELSVNWLSIGGLNVDFGLKLDSLSLMMLLIVTGVGGAIHIYSLGYMRDDPGFSRFYACMSLFTFSMLGIVLSNNFLQMFIFWELVGVSSYLLIGFWFEKASAADAAKKAFITNRLGDFGFMLGILIIFTTLGSLNFTMLESANVIATLGGMATLGGLLIFCGAMGKSAQFPLHVWLPDAMEGPTPVSALIHAATMVAAGVYMLCRVFFIFTPDALAVIAWIGGITALLAALIAIQQNDIKRILAYSTLSQLGYMVMAVGLTAPEAGMFHLTTHAFFKALLFLGAGSVIIALHHEQDIWKMGGLRKKMPVTFWTFMVGTLALAGVWPLSGFFSKDAILAAAHEHNLLLFILGVAVAALTTFYMFRLVFVAFLGERRTGVAPVSDSKETAQAGHERLRQARRLSHEPHESPGVVIWPLRILAVASVVGGVIGIEALFGGMFKPDAEHPHGLLAQLVYPFQHAPVAALSGLAAFAVGLFAAWKFYANAKSDPLPEKLGALSRAMRNRFYFDEIYEATVIRIHDAIAAISDWIDRWIVEGFCIGLVRGGTDLTGRALRLVQTGNLQTYAFLFVLGVAVVLWFVLGK
ncbi:MAG: NADH-quinone oxidoreductase subunit L [Verrucomicrobia bacterium]|nr:NADH-quinone oxidoreductase subunit L [Verrucomicrobiota bacterium]